MELSRDLMVGMLRRGSTGDEVLRILDLIVSDLRSEGSESDEVADVAEAEVAFA
jgi:hypothetical protein